MKIKPEGYYPGYTENIKMNKFEDVKNYINKKYKTSSDSLQIRKEFETAYNKLFTTLIPSCNNNFHALLYVLMTYFNIDEIKAFRYLNKKNKELVETYVVNEFGDKIHYYKKQRENSKKNKLEKKGKKYFKCDKIETYFE